MIFVNNLSAQTGKAFDMNSGKYHAFEKKADFRHTWSNATDKSNLAFSIDFKKRDYKPTANISVDVFLISIKKCYYKGVDIASSFTEPIEILTLSANERVYRGSFTDPITKNSVYAYIEYINDKTIKFYTSVSPSPMNDQKKGTVLPENPVVLSRGL